MTNPSLLQVLKSRSFLYLILAEVFSQIAANIVNFVLLIVAFDLSNSNTVVSGVVLAFMIPSILFGIPAGIYVDRWNKKKVLFLTNAVRAIMLVLLALLHHNLFFVYTLTFIISLVTQFFVPAETPMIPRLVNKQHLLVANALFGMGVYGSILVAYGLSGPLLILLGKTNTFFFLSVLFVIASFFVWRIKLSQQQKDAQVKTMEPLSVRREISSLFSLMAKTKEVSHSLFLLTLSQILILILAVIGPGYAKQILSIPVDSFLLLFVTPAALGMVIGAVIIGTYFNQTSKYLLANIGVFLSAVAVLVLPYGSSFASKGFITTMNMYLPDITVFNILVFLAFIMGFANALVFVPSNTILQEYTSDELRGKVYGALNTFVGIFSLIPTIAAGGLADIFGVAHVLTGIGIFLLLVGGVRLLVR